MDNTKLFEMVDSLAESYVSVWEEVCSIESPTHSKAGVDAVGSYFVSAARARGWQVEIHSEEVSGDVVCITLNPDASARPLCLSAHLDTVHPIGSFGTPAVRRDGDRIYGPGVTDCKGGAVAALLALDALDRCGFTERPVRLLLQSDEEVGSRLSAKDTIRYICERSRDAVAFLNLEGGTEGEVCVARKGIVSYRFDVHGIEAHASKCATEGASAIVEAAHKIIELEKLKDDDGITCSCGTISGGTVVNTVPGSCSFCVNIRFVSNDQLEWIDRYMREVADTVHVPGTTCDVSRYSYRVAMERTERNLALVDELNRIFAENGFGELKPVRRSGGSDAADVTEFGIPCIDSVGVCGGAIHSGKEYAHIPSLSDVAKRLAAIAVGIK